MEAITHLLFLIGRKNKHLTVTLVEIPPWEGIGMNPLVTDNSSIQVIASRDGQVFEHTAVWNHSILQPMMYALSILIAEGITIAVVGALLLLFFSCAPTAWPAAATERSWPSWACMVLARSGCCWC